MPSDLKRLLRVAIFAAAAIVQGLAIIAFLVGGRPAAARFSKPA